MTNTFLKHTTLLFSLLAVLLMTQACHPFGIKATGDDMTQTFDETNFHGLDLSVPATVEVRIGSEFSVEITCEETAMPYVETRVDDGILEIKFSRHVYDVDHMKVLVTAPSWDQFDISSSGKMKILDTIDGDVLHIDISGSGSVDASNATFNKADFEISGSGDLTLAGSAHHLEGEISGSGSVDCLDFPVNTAHLEVSGSGNIKVTVHERLDAEVTGSGDIEYEGNPQLNVQITGSGKVRKH